MILYLLITCTAKLSRPKIMKNVLSHRIVLFFIYKKKLGRIKIPRPFYRKQHYIISCLANGCIISGQQHKVKNRDQSFRLVYILTSKWKNPWFISLIFQVRLLFQEISISDTQLYLIKTVIVQDSRFNLSASQNSWRTTLSKKLFF